MLKQIIILTCLGVSAQCYTSPLFDILMNKGAKTVHKPISNIESQNITFHIIEQKLDHFNPSDSRTILLHYFIEESFCKPNGPIFLSISESLYHENLRNTHLYDMARDLGACIIIPEMRFYFNMHSYNTSMDIMQYVTYEQRIEDYIHLIRTLKKEEQFSNSKVVAFGCGMFFSQLATWIKVEYPDEIEGAVASSALVNVKPEFREYFDDLGDSIAEMEGESCRTILSESFKEVMQLVAQNESKQFQEIFQLCNPISFELEEISLYMVEIAGVFDALKYDICPLLESFPGTSMQKFRKLVEFLSGGECTVPRGFQWLLDHLKEGGISEAARPEMYSLCKQIGLFQISDSPNMLFADSIPLSFFTEHVCPKIFDSSLFGDNLIQSIDRVNKKYGGLKPNVTNLVSVQGSRVFGKSVGILEDLNPSSPAIVIEGEFECADMKPAFPTDRPELKAARQKIREHVTKWVQ